MAGTRRVLLVALVLVGAGCDWTTFGFDASGGRNNWTEKTIGVGNVASLSQAWTAGGDFVTAPTVADGVVYVGSADDKLYAFDASGSRGCDASSNCTPLWTGTMGAFASSSSTPAVANGAVDVGAEDGKLYAFDASGKAGCAGTPVTCSPLWTASTGGSVNSSPVVVNGVLYVGSADGNLYAFDASGSSGCAGTPKTCAPLWTAATGGPVNSSPSVANGIVYVGSGSESDSMLVYDASGAMNCSGRPKTCDPLWVYDIFGVYGSMPSVVDGRVYVADLTLGDLYVFDAAGSNGCSGSPKLCEPIWTYSGLLHSVVAPAVANGIVYTGSHPFCGCAGALNAVDATTGAIRWSADTGNEGGSSPAVANGVVYVGSADGTVYAFDAGTGTSLWTATVGVAVQSPTIANGILYVSSSAGLLAFEP